MTKILSKNSYLVLQEIKIGQQFSSKKVGQMLQLKGTALGGALSTLTRLGYIKPLYKDTNRNVFWKRVK